MSPSAGNQRSRNRGRAAGETLKSNLNVLSQMTQRNKSAKARKELAEKTMQEKLQAERHTAFINKFAKDYEQVLADMQNQDGYEPNELLTFEQAGSILCTLGFLPENVTPTKPDYGLFEELWELLEGNQRRGVRPDDFSYILQVIRGSRFPEREVDAAPDEEKKGVNKTVLFDPETGGILVRKGGQKRIANKFRSFYTNKMNVEDYSKARSKRQVHTEPDLFTRKPYVSSKSKKLANQARTRVDTEGQHDIVHHLYNKEKHLAAMKQQQIDEAILRKANAEEEELTFKPKTLNYSGSHHPTSTDRCLDLYRTVKPAQYAENTGLKGTDLDPELQ